MLNFVIFGAPGSGKGTYSAKLKEIFQLEHISTGDVLRGEIRKGSDLGIVAKSYIDKGQLIPDELMIGILANVYDNLPAGSNGVILDGFPRTITQAEALAKMFDERNEKLTAVIDLEVSQDILLARLLRRAKLEGRADDNEETIKKRFEVYHTQTKPLADYFKEMGVLKSFYYTDELGPEGMVREIAEYIKSL
ncbi:MAG: adenylate kinase [Bacteroidaceae bacterium]|nr:adenylate kinase [Bacteroidaceae bacterium]